MTNEHRDNQRRATDHVSHDSELDISGPAGFRMRVRSSDMLMIFAVVSMSLLLVLAYGQYVSQDQLRLVVAASNRQIIATSRLTCILMLPIEERGAQFSRNSYCDTIARDQMLDLFNDNAPKRKPGT